MAGFPTGDVLEGRDGCRTGPSSKILGALLALECRTHPGEPVEMGYFLMGPMLRIPSPNVASISS